jgi:hypothetical protein
MSDGIDGADEEFTICCSSLHASSALQTNAPNKDREITRMLTHLYYRYGEDIFCGLNKQPPPKR